MHRCRALAVVCSLLVVELLANVASADPPPAPGHAQGALAQQQAQPYVVLKGDNVGQMYPVSSPTYAYGWFGVCPRARHVNDGTGYYNHYHQSSIRKGY
jgi:hypothetical protein